MGILTFSSFLLFIQGSIPASWMMPTILRASGCLSSAWIFPHRRTYRSVSMVILSVKLRVLCPLYSLNLFKPPKVLTHSCPVARNQSQGLRHARQVSSCCASSQPLSHSHVNTLHLSLVLGPLAPKDSTMPCRCLAACQVSIVVTK